MMRKYAVIGHPIGHTMSPFIHKRLFELSGESGEYGVLDIPVESLGDSLNVLDELAGYNITIPHKQAIIPFLDRTDARAELYGSVNTVRNGSIREGFTTDPDGFLKSLSDENMKLEGRVCILGCGGVARTFAYEALLAGCSVIIAARVQSIERAKKLAAEAAGKTGNPDVSAKAFPDMDNDKNGYDLLVNATPVGMYPHTDSMPVSSDIIARSRGVFDAVYNPLKTRFVLTAEELGVHAVGGMGMLVWQAVAAHEIWDGSTYDREDIHQLIEDSAKEMKRIFS